MQLVFGSLSVAAAVVVFGAVSARGARICWILHHAVLALWTVTALDSGFHTGLPKSALRALVCRSCLVSYCTCFALDGWLFAYIFSLARILQINACLVDAPPWRDPADEDAPACGM